MDNYGINEIYLSSFREKISIIAQDTLIFNDTVRNKILYSRRDAGRNEVEEASKLAGAHGLIKSPSKGFET